MIPRSFPSTAAIWILIGILIGILMTAPASAELVSAYGVSAYSVTTDPGMVIYQIIIDPIPMGSNQTHTLNYNGAVYLLTIGSVQSYGVYHDFDISLTHPNGTVESKQISTIRISGGQYKTTIQPVFSQAQSVTNLYLTVDLQVGLSPVSAGFNSQPAGWIATSAIPFTAASGDVGSETNIFIYEMTVSDFENNVINYNPLFGVQNIGSTVFQWTWDQILGLIYSIPYFGPGLINILDSVKTIVSGLTFWIVFVITNLPAFIAGVEVLIWILAVVLIKGKATPEKVLKNIWEYNVKAVTGFISGVVLVYDIFIKFIELVTRLISNLKPGG